MIISRFEKYISSHADEVEAAKLYDAYVKRRRLDLQLNFESDDDGGISTVLPAGGGGGVNLVTSPARRRDRSSKDQRPSYKSRFKGVSWKKCGQKWQAEASAFGEKFRLGTFSDELEAARAYDDFIIDRELGRPLNFPEGGVRGKKKGRLGR